MFKKLIILVFYYNSRNDMGFSLKKYAMKYSLKELKHML